MENDLYQNFLLDLEPTFYYCGYKHISFKKETLGAACGSGSYNNIEDEEVLISVAL
jgi:hypothetical protein